MTKEVAQCFFKLGCSKRIGVDYIMYGPGLFGIQYTLRSVPLYVEDHLYFSLIAQASVEARN